MTLNNAFRYQLLCVLAIFIASTLSAQNSLSRLVHAPQSLPRLQYGPAPAAMDTEAPIFITAPVYFAETDPRSVAVGDFNGDGKPDLAVANQCELSTCDLGSVSVLLGNGDGTLQPAVSYPTTSPSYSYFAQVVVGDFNGDGKADLVVLNEQDTGLSLVSVLLGKGDGTFQPAVSFNQTPNGVFGLVLGDFNKDGKPDVAVTDGKVVTVFLGKGVGTFQTPVSYAVPAGTGSILVGDLNNDGNSDFVVAGNNGTTVLLGNGDGTFTVSVESESPLQGSSMVLGDFNGDGKLDLIFTENLSLGILFGNGDGTFQAQIFYPWPFYGFTFMAAGDFNGDGKQDLAVVSECGQEFNCATQSVSVLLGNGDGTFQPPLAYAAGSAPGSAIATVDFNNDGKLDLVVTGNSAPGSVSPLLGNGDGTFRAPVDYAAGSGAAGGAVGDFNGDGKLDLAVAAGCISIGCGGGGGGAVSVLLGNGDGTYSAGVNYPTQRDSLSVAVGDFNGDGKLDLAVTNACSVLENCNVGSVSVLLGNGDGTFQPAVNYPTENAPAFVAVGDFNGDGKVDLVVANTCISHYCTTKGSLSFLYGNGDGTFQPAINHPTGRYPRSLVVGDFNGDGKADVAVVNSCADKACTEGQISVLLGKGNGTFHATNYLTHNGPFSVAAGDLNGDGKIDLVVAMSECPDNSCYTGLVSVFLGNGDGTFQSPLNFSTDQQEFSVVVADFNGDGKPDVVAESWLGMSSLLLGNGDGTLQAPTNFWLPFGHSLVTGDFNRDGKPDLAVSGTGVAILLNEASGFRYATTPNLASSPDPAYAGQTVTLTASIVPSFSVGKPTGTVTFQDGVNPLATVSLRNGKATFSTSSLTVGAHKLTIAYSGDSKYVPELSSGVAQTIQLAPTTTTLSSNLNPSTAGQSVTFTAMVKSAGPSAPTGRVVFRDGTKTIGSKIPSGGVAIVTKSNLATGSHSITATYDGDAASAKSTSTVLTQVVN